ncbi:MAG: insulinase family protein [Clostridiales bacterium]|nr:insulinase family protein [Candidatus Blautia equi]
MRYEAIKAYEILKEEELTDIASKGYLLRHKKTGARVLLIENEDENKVFNIAFRTTPVNSTGVAHIMEHSVLCGSREFPLKDPFVELVKGSMNTFLNAMTYSDKTCYPVASCNDQDFQNLIHVYLDAVFYPNIYNTDKTFRQEGWNYHLEDVNGPLTYNGVVYNEMKGAFSSPDQVLEREIMNSLFPDTTYGVESGGDPKHIPELSYEEYLNFHRKYYHPSNSFIYLYGNMDMAEKLAFIDEKYLSAFDYLKVDSEVEEQKPFAAMKDLTMEYPIGDSEGEENNTYFSYNTVVGSTDAKLCMAFEILDYALLSAPGAPLKQAILDAGVGEDVYGNFDDGILQPYFTIIAKGANTDQKALFLSTIRQVLEGIAEKGIDSKALEAGLNYFEFRYREADFSSYPKGLMYGLDIMGEWLYEKGDPFSQVKQLAIFEELKKEVGTGYFENLIRTYLLNNPHSCMLTLVPSKGLAAKKEQELAEKLEAYRASLDAETLEKMVAATEELEAYQGEEEDPENLKCIPMLKRSDLKKEADRFINEERSVDGNLFLYHNVRTNGIGYLDLMFEITGLSAEKIPYLGLLKSVLCYIDTEKYTFGELFNVINARSGGLQCGVDIFEDQNSSDNFRVMFTMKGKALYSQMGFLYEMGKEILLHSRLEDTKRLKEIVAQTKSRAQAGMVSSGHGTAVLRASSYTSSVAAFQDELAGIGYYQFIEALDRDFEEKKEELVAALKSLLSEILNPEKLMVSYTGEEVSLADVEALTLELKKSIGTGVPAVPAKALTLEKKNEGFMTSGQVQYVAQTGNFREKGYDYTGALSILKVILGYDYMWLNIRVKGGAYGCMNGFKRNGDSYFVSYRDPHLKHTLEVYRGIPDYVRSFTADEREMTKYIIGTISGKDVPKTPQMKGSVSKSAYFCNVSEEMVQRERDEILNASEKDIQALAPLIEAILENQAICVVGSESVINKDQDVLKSIKPLITC